MKWVTRERVKVDRVACPWLIKRFIDPDAVFLFVPSGEVMAVAEREGAVGCESWREGERALDPGAAAPGYSRSTPIGVTDHFIPTSNLDIPLPPS